MLDKKYIKIIRTILSKKGIDEDQKEEMVMQVTGNRTASIRQMYTGQAISMIKALNKETDQYKETRSRLKRKVLALAHEMGWEHESGKVDMGRVNRYCQTRGAGKKVFNWYSNSELQTLIIQFQNMRINYLKNETSTI